MKTSFLTILFIFITFSSYAQVFSIRSEEDIYSNCDLSEVAYAYTDVSGSRMRDLHRLNFIYDKNGKYLGVLFDREAKNCEPQGFILNEEKGEQSLIGMVWNRKYIQKFLFNDAFQDASQTPPDNLTLNFGRQVPILINISGVNNPENHGLKNRYRFAKKEAVGAMDYRMYLPNSNGFLLVDNVLYNSFDFGNYMWGIGMKRLGFSYLEVKIGSEINGIFSTRSQNEQGNGVILTGDSKHDQKAIKAGFYSEYAKIDPKVYIENLRRSVINNTEDFNLLKDLYLNKTDLLSDVDTIVAIISYSKITESELMDFSSGLTFLRWDKYSAAEQEKILRALIASSNVTVPVLRRCREQIDRSDFTTTIKEQLLNQLETDLALKEL